jgi:transcriptional regulator of met regulon
MVQLPRDACLRKTIARSIAVGIPIVVLTLLSLNNRTARAIALTEETRAALIKSAEKNCFDGQSKQEANKSRKPEQLHSLCYCVAEKLSYTMTMEKAIDAVSKPFLPTVEEQQVMRAIFDNWWQVNVK